MLVKPLTLFISFFFPFSLSIQAQKLEVLEKTDSVFGKFNSDAPFSIIDSPIETGVQFVATIRATIKRQIFSTPVNDLAQMQIAIARIAKKLGANSFSIRQYHVEDSSKDVCLVLDTYRSPASMHTLPQKEDMENILYVFPSPAKYSNKPFRFRFNREKIKLGYREYFVCHLEPGDLVKIRKSLAARNISIYGRMPCLILAFYPYNLSINEGPDFVELSEEYRRLYLQTFFIHPKTCVGCVIPPGVIPKAAGGGSE